MTHAIIKFLASGTVALFLTGAPAFADSFTYTGSGKANGYPVSGVVSIQTTANSVTVQLTDTVVNPTSIDQSLSAVVFELSTNLTGNITDEIASSSATQRSIRTGGSFSDVSGIDPNWLLTESLPNFVAVEDSMPQIPPAHTIVGPPAAGSHYSNANATLAGNASNNPFLAGTATFVLSLQGVTANTKVEKVDFAFGPPATAITIPGTPAAAAVPEPSSVLLFATGWLAAGGVAFRRKLFRNQAEPRC